MSGSDVHEVVRPAKKPRTIWRPPRGFHLFSAFKQVAAVVDVLSTQLMDARARMPAGSGDYLPVGIRMSDALALGINCNEMVDTYHAIFRMRAWTEENHVTDELGLNDVLTALFLGLARRAADGSFTSLYNIYVLDTLGQISPSLLICKQAQRVCENFL